MGAFFTFQKDAPAGLDQEVMLVLRVYWEVMLVSGFGHGKGKTLCYVQNFLVRSRKLLKKCSYVNCLDKISAK